MLSQVMYAGVITQNTAPPFWDDTILQVTANSGSIIDESSYALPLTFDSNHVGINAEGFVVLTGSGVVANGVTALGTDDFTVELLLKRSGGDSSWGGAVSSVPANGQGSGFAFSKPHAWVGEYQAGSNDYRVVPISVPLNELHHWAFIKEADKLYVYKNGVLVNWAWYTEGWNLDSTVVALGRRYNYTDSWSMYCEIKLRIIKGVVYLAADAPFTPPTDFPRG